MTTTVSKVREVTPIEGLVKSVKFSVEVFTTSEFEVVLDFWNDGFVTINFYELDQPRAYAYSQEDCEMHTTDPTLADVIDYIEADIEAAAERYDEWRMSR